MANWAMAKNLLSTSRSLPIALLRARERVMGPLRAMLVSAEVTEQQWRVLRVLQERGPLDPTRIAEQAVLLLPSLTRILQKLEEKGYLSRQQDKTDRRKQIVRITPSGAALIEANIDASIALLEQVRTRMGADRYEALLDLLNELDGSEPHV
jgi:homoprotocatechuate degradation regulator HpaR